MSNNESARRAPTMATPQPGGNNPAEQLVLVAIQLIDSGLDVLHHRLTSDQLAHQSALIPGGSLGKHFRHVTETFDALLIPLLAMPTSGTKAQPVSHINYDALLPSSRQSVARSVDACRNAMQRVRDQLEKVLHLEDLGARLDQDVELVAITPTRQEMRSTWGRELWFCALHSIHHYTMVRAIAVHELGISLPVEFGTAPSTILYRGSDWKPPAVQKAKL